MRVFVAGGTGAIGGYAVPALVAAGHTVTALARNPGKAEELKRQGAEPISVSLFDSTGLAEVVRGHGAIVNLASALPPTTKFISNSAWADCERVRTEGSASVVAAAQAAGVPRIVQESVVMFYRDGGNQWIDENGPVDQFPIAAGNHAAEANAHRFAYSTPWVSGPGRAALLLRSRTTSITRSLRVSNARFRANAGWAPSYPSVWEGYAAMAMQRTCR